MSELPIITEAQREEKLSAVARIRSEQKVWSASDITEGDVEKFICCGVPIDNNGNLKKFSASTLAKHFSSKRLSRQHLREVNQGKADIDRFDLITLNFFLKMVIKVDAAKISGYIAAKTIKRTDTRANRFSATSIIC